MINYADSGIGTIIYLIIIVIVSIISAIKKKTNEKPDAGTGNPSKPVKTWEEILAETLDVPHKTEQEQANKPVFQTVEIPDRILHKYVTEKKDLTKPITKSFVKTTISSPDTAEINSEQSTNQAEISDSSASFDFDIRKAVIYSEILNKKYP
jgi:hypothetical protein